VDVASLLLAPVRVPLRVAQALDDLATLAERARRDPDPVEEVRERVDTLIAEIRTLNVLALDLGSTAVDVVGTGRQIVDGGAELTAEARGVRAVAREIVDGGQELTAEARALRGVSREIVDGGQELTAVGEALEVHLRTFRAALPRLLEGLDTVEELEEAVETVADTVEPLQGAAERVGRVTQRFSRSS
jgi:methyl-accepting chemotaxis protein